jgi:hypothetical protein
VADTIKETSKEAIAIMKESGLYVVMLTGDNKGAAGAIGKQAGVDEIVAEVLPEDKAGVIAKLQTEDFHCVIGSRWLHLGDTYIKRGCFRHITGRFFATCISFYLDLPVYDSQCGAKLFSAEAAKIVFQSPFATRWLFDVEIIKRLQQYYGKKTPGVLEFPVSHWEDTAGCQISVWQVMNDLLKLWKF